MSDTETYPGGFQPLMQRANLRREPLNYAEGEALVGLETDLESLLTSVTFVDPPKSDSAYAAKCHYLQKEFQGQPEICYLNALVIAHLRKNEFPDHAPALFQRIWAEHGDFLLRRLPLRWLVSSITTFGDRGVNEQQRIIGSSMTMMFGMIKLYEFERLYTGVRPSQPHSTASKINTELPLDIPAYSLKGGGLDVALLSRLWKDSDADPVVAPLAQHLLTAINKDPGTIFRRLRDMSDERKAHLATKREHLIPVPQKHVKTVPATISWGVAATVNEETDQAICFAAHHIDLGADAVVLFVDDPDHMPHELVKHPKIEVVLCTEAVISGALRERLVRRNARKAFYFNHARRIMALDWLAMLDVDEYLLSDAPMRETLAEVPGDAAFVTMPVIERFANSETLYRPPASAYKLKQSDRETLYPTFGPYLPDLLLGPAEPRLFVRGKLGAIRVGNFIVKHEKKVATNGYTPDNLRVAHCHADSIQDFEAALPRRIDEGYKRRKPDGTSLKSILDTIDISENRSEFAAFFSEIAEPRPEVLDHLKQAGALYDIDLDLAPKIESLINGLEL